MDSLIFPGAAVLELLAHAKSSLEHSAGYGSEPNPGPGLLFVKDDGIYIMSNGKPAMKSDDGKTRNKVVYAQGYEPPRTVQERGDEDWDYQYEKIQAAAGGDDFVEFIPVKDLEALTEKGHLKIILKPEVMELIVVELPDGKDAGK